METNASIAAIAMIAPPKPPRIGILSAPKDIGVFDTLRSNGLVIPTVTKITRIYKREISPHASSIPSGILRAGFFISSATLQTLVKPPKETKIRPAVEIIDPYPNGTKLSKLPG